MKRITVAIVEDHAPTRTLLTDILASARALRFLKGFPDAESALAEMEHLAPDVVVMDIQLPGQSGITATRTLKRLLPQTQFVMFTVSADTGDVMQALKSGASGYLLKHASPEDLVQGVLQAWGGGVPMSAGIARKVVEALYERPAGKDEQLTPREDQILDLLGKGYVPKEIGITLQISLATVRFHIRRIYAKLHVHSRGEAIVKRLR